MIQQRSKLLMSDKDSLPCGQGRTNKGVERTSSGHSQKMAPQYQKWNPDLSMIQQHSQLLQSH